MTENNVQLSDDAYQLLQNHQMTMNAMVMGIRAAMGLGPEYSLSLDGRTFVKQGQIDGAIPQPKKGEQ